MKKGRTEKCSIFLHMITKRFSFKKKDREFQRFSIGTKLAIKYRSGNMSNIDLCAPAASFFVKNNA